MALAHAFPMVNQLHEPTMDGAPDENAQNNCVPAVLAACLEYWTERTYDGDEIKDSAYGQGYTGTMAIGQFQDYCARQGVRLIVAGGVPNELLSVVRAGVHAGIPVVCTIPSQWGAEPAPTTGSTHVVAIYDDDGAALTAMNPWGGFAQKQPYAWWVERFRMGEVWRVEPMAGTPQGWSDDGTTLTAPNGKPVTLGFRQHILSENWNPALVPANTEYGAAGGDVQDFSLQLHFDQSAGQVIERAGTMESAAAQIVALQAQVAELQAQLAAAGGSGSVEAINAVRALKVAFQDVN